MINVFYQRALKVKERFSLFSAFIFSSNVDTLSWRQIGIRRVGNGEIRDDSSFSSAMSNFLKFK